MNRNALVFIALAVTMLFGAGFAAFGGNVPTAYPMLGGPIVGLAWIAVGMFGRCDNGTKAAPGGVQDTVRH